MFIYNLFPRFYGPFSRWIEDLDRIRDLGFNWIYVNPVSYPGFSGSLYAIKDHYAFNPMFIDKASKLSPKEQFENFIREAEKRGMKVIVDLVVNHTAIDSNLVESHPNWYKRKEDGDIKRPGAWDNGVWVEWGDLAEVDNENSPDKSNLWKYWKELVEWHIDLGVKGFRCDYAYNVPSELWNYLISNAKSKDPEVKFFAEVLGGPFDKAIETAKSGFDYVFSSAKWWNFVESWFVDQYREFSKYALSIGFPESHDTIRINKEYDEDLRRIKQRIIFTALIHEGFMIPVGLEFGYVNKLDVVHTNPDSREIPSYDISAFIKHIIDLKKRYVILSQEGISIDLIMIDDDCSMFLKRSSYTDQLALFVVNRNSQKSIKRFIDFTSIFGHYDVTDVINGYGVPKYYEVEIPRAGILVFVNNIY